MAAWLSANAGTFIAIVILILIVASIVSSLIRDIKIVSPINLLPYTTWKKARSSRAFFYV